MHTPRFRIDLDWSGNIALFRIEGHTWLRNKPIWQHVETFDTIGEARECHAVIKDLPEYLN